MVKSWKPPRYFCPPVLHHPYPAPFRAVVGRQFFQADHAVGDAVHGLVEGFGGQVVQQQHRGVIAHEVMLDRQDLPAIAQRALREQADLRQAVDDHAGRLDPFDHLEDLPGGLAQLQVGGVQQALLVVSVEQAFGWSQFEDMDVVIQVPTVGLGALAQLALGFGQGDVQRRFAVFRTGLQKMQGDGGFTSAGFTFQQEQMATREPTAKNVVKTFDADGRLFTEQLVGCRQELPSDHIQIEERTALGAPYLLDRSGL